MAYTWEKANANTPSRRTTQYFEMLGIRGIYHDGWMASTSPPSAPWIGGIVKMPDVLTGYKWELYNIAGDYSQHDDLASKMSEKLRSMQEVFLVEASKYNVFPLNNQFAQLTLTQRPSATAGKNVFIYTSALSGLDVSSAPSILNRSYTITAEIEVPKGGGEE